MKLFVALMALTALSACGGGGSGGGRDSGPQAPSLTVSADQSVEVGSEVILTATATDPQGDAVTFSWTKVSGVAVNFTGSDSSQITFTAPPPPLGRLSTTLEFEVSASDPQGNITTESSQVVVELLTLSGQLRFPVNTFVDSDSADELGFPLPGNNSIQTAQAVSNPAEIGGFVSARSGLYRNEEGRNTSFAYVVDETDHYLVTLFSGQTVTLIANPADDNHPDVSVPPVSMELIRESDEAVVATGDGVSLVQEITVPADGDYYLRVTSLGEPSTYNLSIIAPGSSDSLSRQARFVPGEAIVVYETGMPAQVRAQQAPLPGYFVQTYGDHGFGRQFRFTDRPAAAKRLRSAGSDWSASETLQAIEALNQRPDIRFASPNYIRQRMLPADNPFFSSQWHYPLISLPEAWAVPGVTGADSIVAVLDTGILPTHPDLIGQLVPGYDFISNVGYSRDGDGLDPDPTDPGDSALGGSSFHGTHVAGTVAAADNLTGVVGVAFGARVMPLRVLGLGGEGSDLDLLQAILFAAGLPNDSGTLPARRADVINMSLGGPVFSRALEQAVQAAIAEGVIVVAAAGNESSSQPVYPAAFTNVVSVSAVDPNRDQAPYSNFGPTVDVAAPGGNRLNDLDSDGYPDGVLSTWADDSSGAIVNRYVFLDGTSMAAPHVAGVAALMSGVRRSNGGTLTPAEFNAYLEGGDLTDDIGAPGRDDQFGYGLINAAKAIDALGELPFPSLSSSPTLLNFQRTGTQVLTLNLPSGVSVLSATVRDPQAQGWLSLDDAGDGDPATYRASVDDSGLETGVSYRLDIRFEYTSSNGVTSENRTLTVPVTLSIVDPDTQQSAGTQFILLLAPGATQPTEIALADVTGGVYPFAFDAEIRPGDYVLVSGSDLDGDGIICDLGESCGYYPVGSRPTVFTVDRSLRELEFSTRYESGISADSVAPQSAAASGRTVEKFYRFRSD